MPAAKNGHFEVVKWPCENGFPIGDQATEIALVRGWVEIVEYLIKQGASLGDGYEITIHGDLEKLKWWQAAEEYYRRIL